eukprot:gnl/TRDRNA2_/TRDRNA2_161148_c0_seq1.p1 gnl/TRDRNA2_/TRDRNA2_161148_c0~~gnl/TRDRNA2_/TRDRNA2_161148_c0_seq1.p1  ORF type:complete len:277 (+),score=13.28 gnl/TRDRNA2_/TRDRNA2_161148_c0_seq1:68-832(+)
MCDYGGLYLLPTHWTCTWTVTPPPPGSAWSSVTRNDYELSCTSCLFKPKYATCLALYVGAALLQPFRLVKCRSAMEMLLNIVGFVTSSIASCYLPGQGAIEKGVGLKTLGGHFATLLGFAFTVIQALFLARFFIYISHWCHFGWARRWLLGSYLFEAKFLDLLFLTHDQRWAPLRCLQVGGPLLSGMLQLLFMVSVAIFFMTCIAPVLQVVFFEGPFYATKFAFRQAVLLWSKLYGWWAAMPSRTHLLEYTSLL